MFHKNTKKRITFYFPIIINRKKQFSACNKRKLQNLKFHTIFKGGYIVNQGNLVSRLLLEV